MSRMRAVVAVGSGLVVTLSLACAGAAASRAAPASAPLPAAVAPSTAAAADAPLQPPALRLPAGVRPERYALHLTIDPRSDDFRGVADVALVLDAPARVVWLHGTDLAVSRAAFRTAAGAQVAARAVQAGTDFLAFVPAAPLPAGRATLHVEYAGRVSARDTQGLFRQEDGGRWYQFSQLAPTDARRAFPCFDEPGFKVPFALTLTVPAQDRAFANAPEASAASGPEAGWRTVRFRETPPLPTYLLAFAVGPFETVDAGTPGRNGVPVRIVVPQGRAAEARWAAESTPPLLAALEDYFDLPYPYEKLDVLSVPLLTAWGAMENPGLVVFASRSILSPPAEETLGFRRGFAWTQAHELAHQWFGNLVTPAWWDDLWLNESFATWLGSRTFTAWRPTWAGAMRVRSRNAATNADSLASARRVRQPIEKQGDIIGAFDGITYAKGAAVLSMFEATLGEDVFRDGVRRFVRTHAHGTATAADFLAALSAAAGRDVAPAVSSFLDQAGVPLVTLRLACDGPGAPRLALSQRRYLPAGSRGDTGGVWRVPVCVRYDAGDGTSARACTELAQASGTLVLEGARGCPAWVVPNADARGYHLSVLEGGRAPLLAARGARLTPPELVGLLWDARLLAAAGAVPAGDVLAAVERALPSDDRDVLLATADALAGVRPDFLAPDVQPHYAALVRRLFGARARALGFVPRPGEPDTAADLRTKLVSLVALEGEDAQLRAQARALALRWLADRTSLRPDVVPVVLAAAARAGDAQLHARMVEAARTATERRERALLLVGLGQFHTPALLARSLELVLGGGLDVRDSLQLLEAARFHPATREAAFRYVREHFEALRTALPAEAGASLLEPASMLCDAADRREAEAFFAPRAPGLPNGERRLAQVLEGVDQCVAQKQVQAPGLADFLRRSGTAGAAR